MVSVETMLTAGTTVVPTTIVITLDTAVSGKAQLAFEVITTVMASLLASVVVT